MIKKMSISINFSSTEQKNREFIGSYWKQRTIWFFIHKFFQKLFSPNAKIISFSSPCHCEYSYFSVDPQSPTQVGFLENVASLRELGRWGWVSRPESLWSNLDICLLWCGRALLSWEAGRVTRGGHPTLVITVHLSFHSDSFHFCPGISREVL